MKHGIYILTILMALLSLPESGYASIPFFAVANDVEILAHRLSFLTSFLLDYSPHPYIPSFG